MNHSEPSMNTKRFSSLSSSSHQPQPKAPTLQSLLKSGFSPTLKHFNHFLHFLSRTRKFEAIICFFSQMNSNHIKGNASTHTFFFWALLHEHRYEEAHQFIKTQMENPSSLPRRNRIWDALIRGLCVNRNEPEKALSIMRDCFRIEGVLPSSFTFCSLIHSFCSQGMMDKAIEVLEMMTDEKINYPFDNFVCSAVISGFCRIGKPELAVGFYESAESSGGLRPNVVTYTALVAAYCRLGRFEEVCNLIARIEKEGLAVDVVFYSSWMHEYFREGVSWEALRKHREMLEKKINPDTISYCILVDGFSKDGNVEKAVGFLNSMRKDGVEPNLVTYTAIMLGFCKKGKLEEAFAVLKMVEDLEIEVDEFTYAILIDGICRRGDLDRAFDLLNDMEKKGTYPSVLTYNTVINGLCKAGRTSEADEISKGIVGDVVTYSTLIQGYVEEENVMGVLEMKRRLDEAGVRMDLVMCNILIKALFLVGSFQDALAIYKGMPEMDLAADSITYCTLIDGYCKVGMIDEALEIFDEFRATSISSVSCYNCIIHGLCRKGMASVATEVFVELHDRGFVSDVGTRMMLIKAVFAERSEGVLNLVYKIEDMKSEIFGTLCNDAICFLCKKGSFRSACIVFLLMESKGSVVKNKSYYAIMKALTGEHNKCFTQPLLNSLLKRYGILEPRVSKILVHYLSATNVNNALRFLNAMKEIKFTVFIPVTVLRTLTSDGRALDAYKLITGAEYSLPVMDVVDYSMVVDGLCKAGHMGKALDLCIFAKRKGIMLSIITYNSVINGLCQQGCFIDAFRLFDSLEKIDMVPSEITYATLIDTLCKEGYLLDARKLFERMVVKGFEPNTHVYNSLIDGYCKVGQMQEALKLLLDLKTRCLEPDEFTVSSVINGYCQKGDMEGALEFFFEFKRKGCFPDFLGFLFLIRGLFAKGRMEECRDILRQMVQTQSIVDLLKRAETDVGAESIGSFLVSLCDQGNIQEAIMILNEVGSMFFSVARRHDVYVGPEKLKELFDGGAPGTVECKSLMSTNGNDEEFELSNVQPLGKIVKADGSTDRSYFLPDFDFYYALLASLCSRGELGKANKLARKLCNSERAC
ncbi:pentatricopeptide repeat-containing protein At5g57250, mitochondrial [Diospyros lotus]|uniref:pentatricopeptide repeat-containing protein At5g57250, mitochondrial n=1 Tax=Diospyros lotus TaxID=55363 RepID=UPI0022580482|nr:pentatricopeptide repeat-containing protein At5g57250, mitochondrial [Diospyros lotus]